MSFVNKCVGTRENNNQSSDTFIIIIELSDIIGFFPAIKSDSTPQNYGKFDLKS